MTEHGVEEGMEGCYCLEGEAPSIKTLGSYFSAVLSLFLFLCSNRTCFGLTGLLCLTKNLSSD